VPIALTMPNMADLIPGPDGFLLSPADPLFRRQLRLNDYLLAEEQRAATQSSFDPTPWRKTSKDEIPSLVEAALLLAPVRQSSNQGRTTNTIRNKKKEKRGVARCEVPAIEPSGKCQERRRDDKACSERSESRKARRLPKGCSEKWQTSRLRQSWGLPPPVLEDDDRW
jgi:hypothetical protein